MRQYADEEKTEMSYRYTDADMRKRFDEWLDGQMEHLQLGMEVVTPSRAWKIVMPVVYEREYAEWLEDQQTWDFSYDSMTGTYVTKSY